METDPCPRPRYDWSIVSKFWNVQDPDYRELSEPSGKMTYQAHRYQFPQPFESTRWPAGYPAYFREECHYIATGRALDQLTAAKIGMYGPDRTVDIPHRK